MSLLSGHQCCRNHHTAWMTWQLIRSFGTSTNSTNRQHRALWKGDRIWHQQYGTANGEELKKKFAKMTKMISQIDQEKLNKVAFKLKNKNLAWSEWNQSITSVLETPYRGESDRQKLNNVEISLERMTALLYKIWKQHGMEEFMRYWRTLVTSEIASEVIPELMRKFCIIDRHHEAYQLMVEEIFQTDLTNVSNRLKYLHINGVNHGINVLVNHYITIGDWQAIADLISQYPHEKLVLVNSVANRLKLTPKEGLAPVYKELLSKRVNFRAKAYVHFLKALFKSSDVGRQLVSQTDMAARQLNADAEPMFYRTFYPFLVQQLSKNNNKNTARWFLQNVVDQPPNLSLVLYNAMHADGLQTAGDVYQYMLDRNIPLNKETLLTLFRGFRVNALETKCIEILQMMERRGWKWDHKFATEVLSLVADRYDASVVVDYYCQMFPDSKKQIDSLGISSYMESRGITIEHQQRPNIVVPSLDSGAAPNAALNVVYRAVLNTVEDQDSIMTLYQKYKQECTHPSDDVIDCIVSNLCARFYKREAVNLAHEIFVDALGNMKFRSLEDMKSAELLVKYHSRDIKPHPTLTYHADIDKAVQVVGLARHYGLPMTRELFEPIVKYYLQRGDNGQAQRWASIAQNNDAVLTDSYILARLE